MEPGAATDLPAPQADSAEPAAAAAAATQQGHDMADSSDPTLDGFGRQLSDMDLQHATQTGVERRIHMLGTGSIGKMVAHALRSLANPPPVTLIFHRYKLLEAWEKGRKEITLEDDGHPVARAGFDVELVREVQRVHGTEVEKGKPDVYDVAGDQAKPHEVAAAMAKQQQAGPAQTDDAAPPASSEWHPGGHAISDEPIHNLVVTTKAAFTIPALRSIRHRLTPDSTVCFLQNGMGIIDDVNEHIFPDLASRPNYIQGIITHGVNVPPEKAEHDPFFAVHAGHGTISLGLLPRHGINASSPSSATTTNNTTTTTTTTTTTDESSSAEPDTTTTTSSSPPGLAVDADNWSPSSRYLLRTLTRSPILCAVGFTATELLQLQLEKLAVNSILNPLTALLDNRNGSLLYNFALTRSLRLLLAETSQVIRSLPELQHIPNLPARFSPDRLEALVVSVADKTRDNVSSMLADVRAGRKTEIEYINGYIVRRGDELGIKCVVNYMIMQTVIGKAQMTTREIRAEVPAETRSLNHD